MNIFVLSVEDMEQYLHYIGGGAGALALTGVAAASAFYLASRPASQKPLFPLEEQCILEPVSILCDVRGGFDYISSRGCYSSWK